MLRFIAFLLLSLASVTTFAATPYKTESIMLLQPDFVLQERTSSVEALSNYIKAVQAASESVLVKEPPSPTGGYLVLAVRPGGQSMTWLDFQPTLPTPLADRLKTAILAVPPFQARKGVVVFALKVSLWDAPLIQSFPNPTEWSKAMEGRDEPMEIGDLVDKVWPAQAGT
jgi:hypothetical protein